MTINITELRVMRIRTMHDDDENVTGAVVEFSLMGNNSLKDGVLRASLYAGWTLSSECQMGDCSRVWGQ